MSIEATTPVPRTETWETTVETTMYLIKLDSRGREYHEKFGGRVGARVTISSEEREVNQLKTADAAWDVFTNGMLVPTRQTASVTDLRTPDQLTQADVEALFAKNGNAFRAALAKIGQEHVLRRLQTYADSNDVTASKKAALDEALAPFKPKVMGSVAGIKDEDMPTIRELEQRRILQHSTSAKGI